MAPEIVSRIQADARRVKPNAVAQALSKHLANLDNLASQGETQGTVGGPLSQRRMLFAAQAAELAAIRDAAFRRLDEAAAELNSAGAGSKAVHIQTLRGSLTARFNDLAAALHSVRSASDETEYRSRLQQLKKLAAGLARPERGPRLPPDAPTARVDTAYPSRALPASTQRPRYADYQVQPIRYAYAGQEQLAVLDPPPVTEDCGVYGPSWLDKNTVDAKVTPEIAALAEQLEYSPLRILEYVTNEIRFEPYWGSLKGAQGTLHTKAGGPTDHASLLVALLRASNIPAGYVFGLISITDERGPAWIGTKSYSAAAEVLGQGKYPSRLPIAEGGVDIGVQFSHVWVEACVPYGNYRGSRVDRSGYQWIPLDASFKEMVYQPGIQQTATFDFDGYLQSRTLDLPHEKYAADVTQHIKSLPPRYANNTLADVAYRGLTRKKPFDVLPTSLPYGVVQYLDWGTGSGPETAQLPATHRYRFSVLPKNSTGNSLLPSAAQFAMPDILLQRITLAWKGATASDQAALDAWINGDLSAGAPCSVNVVPEVRRDGAAAATGTTAVGLCTTTNQLELRIVLDELIDPTGATHPEIITEAKFASINAADLHALQAYGFQVSDRLISERSARLLTAVRAGLGQAMGPNADPDGVLGEFLHINGLKFARYVSDARMLVGQLFGETGASGNHLGLTSSQTRIDYLFDLPFAVHRSGYLIDWPAAMSRSYSLVTPTWSWEAFRIAGYAASSYESYIWQENALLDAVSSTRGIQFARESGIEVLTVNAANWSTESPKLTSNSTASLNYPASAVSQLFNDYINKGITLTLPRSLIQYDDWKGAVYIGEKQSGPGAGGYYMISSYAGGATVNPLINFADFDFSGMGGYGDGWVGTEGVTSNHALINQTTPTTLNSAQGTGLTHLVTLAGDPVNMVNGNLYHVERDIEIKGRGGMPIVFERSYNGRLIKDGPLGFGWTHTFNHVLTFRDENLGGTDNGASNDALTSSVTWTDGTGSEKFIRIAGANAAGVPGTSVFTTPQGFYFQVARQADGTYTVREKSGVIYTFESIAGAVDQRARLLSIRDRNGNTLAVSYSGNTLNAVTDGLGRALRFTSNAAGRISEIRDWSGRKFQYDYDGQGNLMAFKNPLAIAGSQQPVTYEYYTDLTMDSQGRPSPVNHTMKRYTLPRGNTMTFEYYMNGRVFRHYDALGNTNTFTYNDFRRETVQVNERGNTRRFFFDPYGNPVKIVAEDGATHTYTYDCPQPGNAANCPNPFRRLSSVDPSGFATQYAYDANGNVIRITRPSGNGVEFSHFNAFGEPGKTQDGRGNYTLRKFDANGNVLQEFVLKTGVGASIDPFSYTPVAAELVSWVIHSYDTYGNRLTTKRVKDFSTQAGPIVTYTLDAQGLNVLTVTRQGILGDGQAGSESGKLTYDPLGRVRAGIRNDWYAMTAEYDAVDRRIRTEGPTGELQATVFDGNGNVLGEQLLSGANVVDAVSYGYDLADRVIQSSNNAGYSTVLERDPAGNILRSTNPDGYTVSFEYDEANRARVAYNEKGHSVWRTFDAEGRLRSVTDPNGATVKYEYYGPERDGRLKRVVKPVNEGFVSGQTTEYDYDANGNRTSSCAIPASTTNPAPTCSGDARLELYAYDELNRLVRWVGPAYVDQVPDWGPDGQPVRPVVRYRYDNLGNLVEISAGATDPVGTEPAYDGVIVQATYTHDDFGRRLSKTDALGRSWVWQYDRQGNVIKSVDARGQALYFVYFPGYGRQLKCVTKDMAPSGWPAFGIECGSGVNVIARYERDSRGLVTLAQSSEVTYTYTYDAAKRLESVSDSRGPKTLTYVWSNGGRLNRIIDGEGLITDYLYDSVGQLSGMWTPKGDYVFLDFDPGGRLLQIRPKDDLPFATQYAYNADNSLAVVASVTDTGYINRHEYGYDGFGSRNSRRDLLLQRDVRWRFEYDGRGQLAAQYVSDNWDPVTQSYGAQSPESLYGRFAYDPLGNLRKETYTDGSYEEQEVDPANQLVWRTWYAPGVGFVQVDTWTYDGNGNLTSRTAGSDVVDYTYDAQNRMVGAVRTGELQYAHSYGYDHSGRRIRKTKSGVATHYLYHGHDIYAEYSTWTAPAARTSYGPGIDQALLRDSEVPSEQRWYLPDGQGSVAGVVSTADAIYRRRTLYDAWGAEVSSESVAGESVPQYGYTGRELDDDSFLYYYRARYYFPYARRFLQPDPVEYGAGQVSLYSYVRNDPANLTDPSGLLARSAVAEAGNWFTSQLDSLQGALSSGVQGLSRGSSGEGLDFQVGFSISGTLFGPPTGNLAAGSVGVSGGAGLGISTDGTLSGTSVYGQVQANGLVGGGIFAGVGIQGNVGHSDGPMPSGTTLTPYVEANVGIGKGAGVSANLDPNGGISGGSGSVRGFPGTGAGVMVGGGISTTSTWVSPTAGQTWDKIINWRP
jgi:RHS repeat-associated protein